MSNADSQNVVTKSITIKRDVASAFRVWTEQIRLWWPTSHSLSGDPQTQVFIEGKIGGRFYERTSNGDEFDWGAVQVWEPPHRLIFTWYLGSGQEMPTRVEVQFVAVDENSTRVELEHRGPELIGELWWQRVSIFNASWESIVSEFINFIHHFKI